MSNYEIVSLKLTFNDAQEYCQQRGMQMAMLKTVNEVLQVTLEIRKRNIDSI